MITIITILGVAVKSMALVTEPLWTVLVRKYGMVDTTVENNGTFKVHLQTLQMAKGRP